MVPRKCHKNLIFCCHIYVTIYIFGFNYEKKRKYVSYYRSSRTSSILVIHSWNKISIRSQFQFNNYRQTLVLGVWDFFLFFTPNWVLQIINMNEPLKTIAESIFLYNAFTLSTWFTHTEFGCNRAIQSGEMSQSFKRQNYVHTLILGVPPLSPLNMTYSCTFHHRWWYFLLY